jgi:TetR/AcrR family transcriptional repressor of nem operon
MARVSKARAEEHHRTIEVEASRLFRERGFAGVSVAEVMAQAGLTHGGFYAHYPSKDALAAAACANAFAQSATRWRTRIEHAATPADALRAVTEGYLDSENRDRAATACPAAMLASDVAREASDHAVRAAYLAGVRTQVDMLTALQHSGDASRDRQRACVQLSALVGALVLARATRGATLSDEILTAAKDALLSEAAATTALPIAVAAAKRRVRRGLPKDATS